MQWRLTAALLLLGSAPAAMVLGFAGGDELAVFATVAGLMAVALGMHLLREEAASRVAGEEGARPMPWWKVGSTIVGGNGMVGAATAFGFGWLYFMVGASLAGNPYALDPYGSYAVGFALAAYGQVLMVAGAVGFVIGLLLVVLPWLPWSRLGRARPDERAA